MGPVLLSSPKTTKLKLLQVGHQPRGNRSCQIEFYFPMGPCGVAYSVILGVQFPDKVDSPSIKRSVMSVS